MSELVHKTGVSHEDLHRYVDGELGGAKAQELAAQIEREPDLSTVVAELRAVGGLVRESLLEEAREVPGARFEQLWDEIDAAIDRRVREDRGVESHPSVWARLWKGMRPLGLPLAAVGCAALVLLLVVRPGTEPAPEPIAQADAPDPAGAPETKSSRGMSDPQPTPSAVPLSDEGLPGSVPAEDPVDSGPSFGTPTPTIAEIHGVDFGGRGGTIERAGTVTVLYVEEDLEPNHSERSL